ncbi:MAG: class I SAM-dependent methyltransferase [Acidimicrobiales bacterium]
MDEVSAHNETVRRSFDKQVPLFTGAASPFASPPGIPERWGPLAPDAIVLDVACGAAHVAEQLAPYVRQVVGVDLTAALLELGCRRLRDAGVRNVLLQEGDAAALPFVDGSFDLVVCRSSLHHFADVESSLREMGRVCRAGGRVAIDELIQPPGADAATRDRFDSLHRLLDPSHVHALTDHELYAIVTETVGVTDHRGVNEPTVVPLELIFTDAADRAGVSTAIDAELAGGPATGFEPSRTDGTVRVVFLTATVHVTKPR